MKLQSDAEYFRERARVELEAAANAVDDEVAKVHSELARGYEALAKSRDREASA